MHTCEIVLNLANAARSEGVIQELLSDAEYEYDQALRHLEQVRQDYADAVQNTVNAINAVGEALPCNADELTMMPGSMPVGQVLN